MKNATLFIDIDGTILEHRGSSSNIIFLDSFVLDGVTKCFNEWFSKGHKLILTTGRPESMRILTEMQLQDEGLFYDLLLMGVGGGERILINDVTDPQVPKAVAINVPRDQGFENINELYHEAKVKSGAQEDVVTDAVTGESRVVDKYEI